MPQLTYPGRMMGPRVNPRIVPDPNLISPLRQVMMGGKMNGANEVLGSTLDTTLTRQWTKWGPTYTPLTIQLVYYNGYRSNTFGIGEVPNTNSVTYSFSAQNGANSNIAPILKGGAMTYTAAGGEFFITDPLTLTDLGFTTSSKNGSLYINTQATVANDTLAIPTGYLRGGTTAATGEINWRTNSVLAASQIYTAGAYTTVGGDLTQTTMSPACIVGTWNNPAVNGRPASIYLGPGDSIQAGFNAAQFNNFAGTNGGAYQHGARSLILPFAQMAVASSSIEDPSLTPFMVDCYKYFDIIYGEDNHNNVSAGEAGASIFAKHMAHNYQAKIRGAIQYWLTTTIPDCTSTDSYATEANQTYRPGFGPVGAAADYVNLVRSQVGRWNTHNLVVETQLALGGVDPWKWARQADVSTTAPAGIHPSPTGQTTQETTAVKPPMTALPAYHVPGSGS